ncbi:MAG: response regulator [Bacteroidota bacterium]
MIARALVVDDDPLISKALTFLLKDLGISDVTVAEDASTALRLLLLNTYDVLLVDWMMPGLNGLDLVKRVRMMLLHDDTPIVMVTSLNESESVREAVQAGINGYILKPPTRPKLQNTLQKLGIPVSA